MDFQVESGDHGGGSIGVESNVIPTLSECDGINLGDYYDLWLKIISTTFTCSWFFLEL